MRFEPLSVPPLDAFAQHSGQDIEVDVDIFAADDTNDVTFVCNMSNKRDAEPQILSHNKPGCCQRPL